MTPSTNRLLPVIAVAVVIVVAVVTVAPSLHAPGRPAEPVRPVRTVDADTTADTLRTVSAQLKALDERNAALAAENERLRRNEESRTTRVDQLTGLVERLRAGIAQAGDSDELRTLRQQLGDLRTQAASMSDSPELRALQQRIGDLERRITNMASDTAAGAGASRTPAGPGAAGGPLAGIVGVGPGAAAGGAGGYRPGAGASAGAPAGGNGLFDTAGVMRSLGIGGASGSGAVPRGADGKPLTGLVWYGALEGGGGLQSQPTEAVLPWIDPKARPATGAAVTAFAPPPAVPRYTIPAWSTLLDATAMTALVGRIATQGTLLDPYPFKILVGPDALAANGHMIPGLTGMVLAGTASGDWGLSCVRGSITGALFVFEDGTTLSYPQGNVLKPQADGQGAGSGGSSAQKLEIGTISDDQGNPCVQGKRITNAASYLTDRVAIIAAGAAAQAYGDSQTSRTSSTGPFGTVDSSSVTGSTGKYVLGATARDAVGEVGKWLDERNKQSWDAIYAPAGARVAVHVSRDIWIDRLPDGRRLVYPHGGSTHVRLD